MNVDKDYNPKTGRWVKKCLDGQVRDVKTFRCVKDRSAPCPDGKQRNPATGRCVQIAKPANGKEKKTRGKIAKKPEDCPEGTKFNPKTRRCNKLKTSLSKADKLKHKADAKSFLLKGDHINAIKSHLMSMSPTKRSDELKLFVFIDKITEREAKMIRKALKMDV